MVFQVLVLDRGKLALDGAPREIFPQVERLKALQLTVPEAVELAWRLRAAGMDLPADVLTAEDCAAAIGEALA